MKYTIDNDRLRELMINVLETKISGKGSSRTDSYDIIWDETYDDNYDGVLFEYDNNDGRLYISGEFFYDFYTLFPFGPVHVEHLIKDWYESKFNVDVKYMKISSKF